MKKLLLFILLLPCLSYGQKIPDYGFDKVTIVTEEQTIQAQLLPVEIEPAKKQDLFYYWYSGNIIHKTQGSFSGRLLDGSYNAYYPDKSLKEQGTFVKGLKDGLWRTWNEGGTLTELLTWKDGIKSGKFELFDDQGNLKVSGKYHHNMIVAKDTSSFWKKINILKKKKKTA